jgi:hypothetical protein
MTALGRDGPAQKAKPGMPGFFMRAQTFLHFFTLRLRSTLIVSGGKATTSMWTMEA